LKSEFSPVQAPVFFQQRVSPPLPFFFPTFVSFSAHYRCVSTGGSLRYAALVAFIFFSGVSVVELKLIGVLFPPCTAWSPALVPFLSCPRAAFSAPFRPPTMYSRHLGKSISSPLVLPIDVFTVLAFAHLPRRVPFCIRSLLCRLANCWLLQQCLSPLCPRWTQLTLLASGPCKHNVAAHGLSSANPLVFHI